MIHTLSFVKKKNLDDSSYTYINIYIYIYEGIKIIFITIDANVYI